jgi:hypothetical protein
MIYSLKDNRCFSKCAVFWIVKNVGTELVQREREILRLGLVVAYFFVLSTITACGLTRYPWIKLLV